MWTSTSGAKNTVQITDIKLILMTRVKFIKKEIVFDSETANLSWSDKEGVNQCRQPNCDANEGEKVMCTFSRLSPALVNSVWLVKLRECYDEYRRPQWNTHIYTRHHQSLRSWAEFWPWLFIDKSLSLWITGVIWCRWPVTPIVHSTYGSPPVTSLRVWLSLKIKQPAFYQHKPAICDTVRCKLNRTAP